MEQHEVGGQGEAACASTARGHAGVSAGHPELPTATGNRPAGDHSRDMGRASWVLAGQPMRCSDRSAAATAGRVMSRPPRSNTPRAAASIASLRARDRGRGAGSWKGLAEEQPDGYKDVSLVVDVVHAAGLARRVARLRPWAWSRANPSSPAVTRKSFFRNIFSPNGAAGQVQLAWLTPKWRFIV